MTLDIRQYETAGKGSITAWDGDRRAAEMTYSRTNPSLVIVDHTEVFDDFKGQGIGKQVVAAVVRWARENNQQIMPLCPFTRRMFQRTPGYADVWYR